MELEHLAAILTRELHIEVPGLKQIVLDAVLQAHTLSEVPSQRASLVVAGVVDGLAHNGTPIEDHVNERSLHSWERDLQLAYLEAYGRASRPDMIR